MWLFLFCFRHFFRITANSVRSQVFAEINGLGIKQNLRKGGKSKLFGVRMLVRKFNGVLKRCHSKEYMQTFQSILNKDNSIKYTLHFICIICKCKNVSGTLSSTIPLLEFLSLKGTTNIIAPKTWESPPRGNRQTQTKIIYHCRHYVLKMGQSCLYL